MLQRKLRIGGPPWLSPIILLLWPRTPQPDCTRMAARKVSPAFLTGASGMAGTAVSGVFPMRAMGGGLGTVCRHSRIAARMRPSTARDGNDADEIDGAL